MNEVTVSLSLVEEGSVRNDIAVSRFQVVLQQGAPNGKPPVGALPWIGRFPSIDGMSMAPEI